MSALASNNTNSFSAHLALAAGVSVSINAPSLASLRDVVGKLQPTEAANDTGKSQPAAATAPAGASGSTTAASSAQPAAAAAATGEAGNATKGGQAAAAPAASSSTPAESPAVTFEALKKAFLALSTKADGRAKCEGVLKPHGLAKLSDAKPEQYAKLLTAIEHASK